MLSQLEILGKHNVEQTPFTFNKKDMKQRPVLVSLSEANVEPCWRISTVYCSHKPPLLIFDRVFNTPLFIVDFEQLFTHMGNASYLAVSTHPEVLMFCFWTEESLSPSFYQAHITFFGSLEIVVRKVVFQNTFYDIKDECFNTFFVLKLNLACVMFKNGQTYLKILRCSVNTARFLRYVWLFLQHAWKG